MPRARSKDPFVAAIKTYLVPAFELYGFKLRGKGKMTRIRNDIVQSMSVGLSAWGGKTFQGGFGANTLFYPREFLHSDFGSGGIEERTPDGKCFRSWPAETHEQADASMQKAVGYFFEQAIPLLERTQTVEGLKAELDLLHHKDLQTGRDLNHHRYFERACCAAKLREYPAALAMLRRAVELYASDGRFWCEGYSQSCRELIAAIERGDSDTLLNRWVLESIPRLRLTEIARN